MLDEPETEEPLDPQADFSPEGLDIVPEADPSLANSMRKQRRVKALIEARNAGMPLNDKYIAKVFLEAIDEPEPEIALQNEPPPPSKDQLDMQKFEKQMEFDKMQLQVNAKLREFDPMETMAKAMEAFAKAKALGGEAEMKQMEMSMSMVMKKMEAADSHQKFIQDLITGKQKQEIEREKADAAISAKQSGTGASS
jgi:hypothetical protein